ncbi:phage tail protein [Billgrantia desiderata]|uniref:phage tail protein n=1 Tax=Billgrantia desiderata TaxID=52021 RepID=UPI001F3A3A66
MSLGAIVVAVEGIESLPDLDAMTPAIERAARQAVNAATDRGLTWSSEEIRKQVNFPASYLRGQDSRLKVVKRAKGSDLESVIRGRFEPTSLARFATGTRKQHRKAGGVTLEIKPGSATFMRRAFLVGLQAGDPAVRNLKNVGLAIRMPRGQRPSAAYKPRPFGDNLWLLYGPSVDQVFRTVAPDVEPRVSAYLDREFRRLLERENA